MNWKEVKGDPIERRDSPVMVSVKRGGKVRSAVIDVGKIIGVFIYEAPDRSDRFDTEKGIYWGGNDFNVLACHDKEGVSDIRLFTGIFHATGAVYQRSCLFLYASRIEYRRVLPSG